MIQKNHKIRWVDIAVIMKDSMVNSGVSEDGMLVNAKGIHTTVQK